MPFNKIYKEKPNENNGMFHIYVAKKQQMPCCVRISKFLNKVQDPFFQTCVQILLQM